MNIYISTTYEKTLLNEIMNSSIHLNMQLYKLKFKYHTLDERWIIVLNMFIYMNYPNKVIH